MAETERLILRCFESTDLDKFFLIERDPVVKKYFASGSRTREQVEEWITKTLTAQEDLGYSHWAVIDKRDSELMGYCGLAPKTVDDAAEVEVGYELAARYWNQGFATEAAAAVIAWGFRHLDVSHLISLIALENAASVRVAEKNGLRLFKQSIYYGNPRSVYRIDRNEWRSSASTSGSE